MLSKIKNFLVIVVCCLIILFFVSLSQCAYEVDKAVKESGIEFPAETAMIEECSLFDIKYGECPVQTT